MAYTVFLLVLAALVLCPGCCQGRLVVPDLTPNTYITPGDLHLGVLLKILEGGGSGPHCVPEPSMVDTTLLQTCEAANYAMSEINNNDHILPNISLGLVCADYCTNPLTGLARALYMIEDHPTCPATGNDTVVEEVPGCRSPDAELVHRKVVGVITPGYSSVTVVVSRLFGLFKIPVLATQASSDELSDKKRYEYFMRLMPPDKFQAQAFIDIIRYFSWSYVGLMYSKGDYGESGAKFIEELVKEQDLCLAFNYKLMTEGEPWEVDNVIKLLNKTKNATVVIWYVEHQIIGGFLKKFERDQLPGHIMLLSDKAAKEAYHYPQATRGSIAIEFVLQEIPGFQDYITNLLPGVNSCNPWLKMAWEHKFQCSWTPQGNDTACQEDHRPTPEWYGDLRIGSLLYEGAYVFAHALHTLISSTCPEAFQNKDLLEECINGEELLNITKHSKIEGLNGTIRFDENGDRLARYRLYHYQLDTNGTQVKVEVAQWEKYSGNLEIKTHKLQWSFLQERGEVKGEMRGTDVPGTDIFVPYSLCSLECGERQYKVKQSPHCCWKCENCRDNEIPVNNRTGCKACQKFTWPDDGTGESCEPIPLDYIRWTDQIAIWLTVFALIGAMASVAFAVCFWMYRGTRLVKATNKELSFTMLLGAFVTFLMVLAFLSKPSKAVCYIRDVGFHAVVTLLYGPLFVKTCKIYFIFRAGKKGQKTPKHVSATGQWVMIATAFTIQACLITAVKIVSPSDTKLHMPVETEPYVELTCLQSMMSFLLPLAYNVIFILICGFLGCVCRKLPENFNESGFIFVSISTTISSWVVFLPTYFTMHSSKHQAMILALCLTINAYITIGCLFAPKIYALFCMDESAIKFSATVTQAINFGGEDIQSVSGGSRPSLVDIQPQKNRIALGSAK